MSIRLFVKKNRLFLLIAAFALLILFFYWQNNNITINRIQYSNDKIPEAYQRFKILQVSDLHNKEFGPNQVKLIKLTKKIKPDIIVVTGDLIDSHRTNINISMDYIRQAVKIAPVYFVTGNHEKWSDEYAELNKQLLETGIDILDNQAMLLTRNKESIVLMGLGDPFPLTQMEEINENLGKMVKSASNQISDKFTILLSHRPELIDLYAVNKIDLVFCGHAHGGQFRLPLVGGLYAPNQGFFPKYTNGITLKKSTSMVVSRGLGNSVIPVRIFNRPELVVVTLNSKKQDK
ncbi:metallophosphoesterase [Anaerocolumna sedimenticola]|uniref:Metallophosphoesterase n=1 Tax=Anaerocolumna sedimenticola TaxID=2696063 RepID=A0A6P1TP68_9FIRM|nr:metallophosphoesterase [Anaerocolumna sedimenticola]QHQ62233.1 metallophosphoesterase [Anaerocolumna sedimenticola]